MCWEKIQRDYVDNTQKYLGYEYVYKECIYFYEQAYNDLVKQQFHELMEKHGFEDIESIYNRINYNQIRVTVETKLKTKYKDLKHTTYTNYKKNYLSKKTEYLSNEKDFYVLSFKETKMLYLITFNNLIQSRLQEYDNILKKFQNIADQDLSPESDTEKKYRELVCPQFDLYFDNEINNILMNPPFENLITDLKNMMINNEHFNKIVGEKNSSFINSLNEYVVGFQKLKEKFEHIISNINNQYKNKRLTIKSESLTFIQSYYQMNLCVEMFVVEFINRFERYYKIFTLRKFHLQSFLRINNPNYEKAYKENIENTYLNMSNPLMSNALMISFFFDDLKLNPSPKKITKKITKKRTLTKQDQLKLNQIDERKKSFETFKQLIDENYLITEETKKYTPTQGNIVMEWTIKYIDGIFDMNDIYKYLIISQKQLDDLCNKSIQNYNYVILFIDINLGCFDKILREMIQNKNANQKRELELEQNQDQDQEPELELDQDQEPGLELDQDQEPGQGQDQEQEHNQEQEQNQNQENNNIPETKTVEILSPYEEAKNKEKPQPPPKPKRKPKKPYFPKPDPQKPSPSNAPKTPQNTTIDIPIGKGNKRELKIVILANVRNSILQNRNGGYKLFNAFCEAANKGIVGPDGESGIKPLKDDHQDLWQVKLLGTRYGDERLVGRKEGNTITFSIWTDHTGVNKLLRKGICL